MKVLCLGHAAYDITLPMDSFPIENKKVRLKDKKVECGGGPAATAAYLLAYWNVPTSFAGIVGNDLYGNKIKEEFKRVHVDTTYLETNLDKSTTASYIIANNSNGSRTIITAKDINFSFQKIKEIPEEFDYILVDGDEDELAYQTIMDKKGKTISMIDAGKSDEKTVKLARVVDYLVCSNDFARDYTGMPLDYQNLETIKAIYDKLESEFSGKVIITLEKYGSFTKINGEYKLVPSIKVKAIDSTGAGDIYHGALLYFISHGYELERAMRLANITSAISVTRVGGRNSIPRLEEVLEYDK